MNQQYGFWYFYISQVIRAKGCQVLHYVWHTSCIIRWKDITLITYIFSCQSLEYIFYNNHYVFNSSECVKKKKNLSEEAIFRFEFIRFGFNNSSVFQFYLIILSCSNASVSQFCLMTLGCLNSKIFLFNLIWFDRSNSSGFDSILKFLVAQIQTFSNFISFLSAQIQAFWILFYQI